MYDQIHFGTEPALVGDPDVRFGSGAGTGSHDVYFGAEPALIGPHDVRFGSGAGTGPHQVFFGADQPPPMSLARHEVAFGADYPTPGAGDQGAPIDNSLAASQGGVDPFAVATFGFDQYELHEGSEEAHRWEPGAFGFEQYDHDGAHRFTPGAFGSEGVYFGVEHPNPASVSEGLPGAVDLMAAEDGENMSFQPVGPDPYDAAEQIPTLRNPVSYFGFEDKLYSGFGPAAVIGCETGQGAILGCDSALGCD